MEEDVKFKFNFKGLELGIVEYSYSPPDWGSYWNPPDPEELEISKLYVYDSYKKTWSAVPDPFLDWLCEDEDFHAEALDAMYKIREAEEMDRGDYKYERMKDRRLDEDVRARTRRKMNEPAQKPDTAKG